MKPLVLVAAITALALAGCNRSPKDDAEKGGATLTIKADSDDGGTSWDASSGDEKTKMSLKLPGGFDFKVDVPGRIGKGSKFDIDGVGLYPGARVASIDVNAQGGDSPALVTLGFTAPGDAAAVADWYQKQFEAKGVKASRTGDGFTGTSEDGDGFTLKMTAAGTGKSRGMLTITDAS